MICLGIVVLVVVVTRMVSLGSVTAALAFPFLAYFYGEKSFFLLEFAWL